MKRLMTLATLLIASVLAGCAAPNFQATATFAGRSDEVIYGRVDRLFNGPQMPHAELVLCNKNARQAYIVFKAQTFDNNIDKWLQDENFCDHENLSKLQQAQVVVGVVDANGNMFLAQSFAPKSMNIQRGDIVAVKTFPSSDGRVRRPFEVTRVAAKAKDATKENGCYWDAGTGVWAGFNQGGAVCEGWHWKDHPFSNPRLLKQ